MNNENLNVRNTWLRDGLCHTAFSHTSRLCMGDSMKLFEKFFLLHRQQEKLKTILEQQTNNDWCLQYHGYLDDAPYFYVYKILKNKNKGIGFKLLEAQLIYVFSGAEITNNEIKEAKAFLDDVLKTTHNNWHEEWI